MADNLNFVEPSQGTTKVATKQLPDLSHAQRMVVTGPDGTVATVDANGLQVDLKTLPPGASTEATLALIKAKTDNIDVALSTRTKPADTQKVDGSGATQPVSGTFWQGTQPVSAAALPLPTGASTEATLALIKAKTDNIDVALSTRTKPSDTQPVSGTFWQATQPVSGTFWQATQPVSGSVSVSNFPATQPVSGSVSISNFPSTQSGTVPDGGDVVEGATTDIAVIGDNPGTVSAKLRGLNFLMDQLRQDVRQTNALLFLILQALNANNVALGAPPVV